jgi:flagellar biosynthesis/type III secretory pathway M-ring protein FliF/YscJ
VRGEVRAEKDFDASAPRGAIQPEGQVVRSTQTVEGNSSSREADPQTVTWPTTCPIPICGGGASATCGKPHRETVNYEISKMVGYLVKEIAR